MPISASTIIQLRLRSRKTSGTAKHQQRQGSGGDAMKLTPIQRETRNYTKSQRDALEPMLQNQPLVSRAAHEAD